MTSKEFIRLVKEAENYTNNIDFSQLNIFSGISLAPERVARRITRKHKLMVSKEVAIAFIQYQAMQLNGKWDLEELNELKWIFVNFVEVVY